MRIAPRDTIEWTIVEKRNEAPNVETFVLETEQKRPVFVAGQYLTVQLQGHEPTEGKSYSISSTPNDERVSLTIKSMGNFSQAILAHTIGDTLTTSRPYGFFHPESDCRGPRTFVAGGIGITPLVSIIENLLINGYEDQLTLFYSNRTRADIVFHERLTVLSRRYPHFTIHHFITRESGLNDELHEGRMTPQNILSHSTNANDTDYFICGSIDFTKNLWKELKDAGVHHTHLYTEGFF